MIGQESGVKLHFVYNVEATPQALVRDFVHRLTDPETYPCRLCDITYGRFVKKPRWQLFLWSLPVASAFYTKDGFLARYPHLAHHPLPVVLVERRPGTFEEFISRDDFAAITSLEALEEEVKARLGALRTARRPGAKRRRSA